MQKLLILGAGGFAEEVLWLARTINLEIRSWDIIGFIDDNPKLKNTLVGGLPVLGGFDWLKKNHISNIAAVCGVGSPKVKEHMVHQAEKFGLTFATLVHPRAQMSDSVTIGEGSIVAAGNVLTVNINIGRHVLINLCSTVGHNSIIEDYCTIAPHCTLSGFSHLENGAELGSGAIIIPGKKVGKWSIVGAGAVVINDIPDNKLAVGVPAAIKTKKVD